MYLQVPPLGGSRDEKWRSQWIRKRSVSGICQNWVNCDGATEVSDHVPHRTTYRQNNSWIVHEIPAEWLPVRWNEVAVRSHVACRRNLITGLTSAASPRMHISSSCKVGQKLGEILYPLICFFLPCLSWLLRSQRIFEIPEGLMNNPVYIYIYIYIYIYTYYSQCFFCPFVCFKT